MLSIIKKLRDVLPASDKKKLVMLFFLMLIAGLLEVVGIGFILAFVSQISDPTWVYNIEWLRVFFIYLNIESSRDMLVFGSISLLFLFIVKNFYLLLFYYIQAKFVNNRFKYVSVSLFEKYMNAPYAFHLQHNSAALIRNIIVETRLLVSHIMMPILFILMETVMVISIGLFLLIMEPLITVLVFFIIGGVGGLFLMFIKKSTKKYGQQAHEDRAVMIQRVNEGLGGLKEIKVMNRHKWFLSQFTSSMKRMVNAETFRQISNQSVKPVIEIFAVGGMLVISLILVLQGREVTSIIPVLTLFGVATFKLMPSLNKLIGEYNTIRYYSHGLEQIHQDLVISNKIRFSERKGLSIDKVHLKQEIRLNNVEFFYDNMSEPILKGVSLSIKKGQVVGFVGSSGSGKTTTVDLILGLLEPRNGTVTVDGVDIRDCLSGWQKNIGYIPHLIYLSDNTIRNNIAFGVDEEYIDDKKLANALHMAQLDDFVSGLPDGVNTVIGENGVKLSGGQRQRIGIARALYHDPDVLIMDEATSSLDNKTEKYIVDSVEKLKNDRTVIIIAHRLTTVRNCDVLFFIKNGRIVAKGRYDELLEKSPEFYSMVDASIHDNKE